MARAGRPTVEITLSANERSTLERWVRRHSSAQALALRSRIVLACAEGRTNTEVGNELKVHPTTVSKWRHRFAPDVTHNVEHFFSLELPARVPVRVAPAEHLAFAWLPWREAAERCFSWSNRDAIRMIAERAVLT